MFLDLILLLHCVLSSIYHDQHVLGTNKVETKSGKLLYGSLLIQGSAGRVLCLERFPNGASLNECCALYITVWGGFLDVPLFEVPHMVWNVDFVWF